MIIACLGLGLLLCALAGLFYTNEAVFFLGRGVEEVAPCSGDSDASDSGASGFFFCNLCNRLPRSPIASFCGHLFCWRCYHLAFTKTVTWHYCPACHSYNKTTFFIPVYESSAEDGDDGEETRPLTVCLDKGAQRLVHLRAALFSRGAELSEADLVQVVRAKLPVPQFAASAVFSILLVLVTLFLGFYR